MQGHGAEQGAQDRAREARGQLVREVDNHGSPFREGEAVEEKGQGLPVHGGDLVGLGF